MFCRNVDEFLVMFDEEPRSVVAVHCKAGKGRTGLMVSCYLLHSGLCRTARQALELYARKRTQNKKGVTIPSQIRYVYYYERLLRVREMPNFTYKMTSVRLAPLPALSKGKAIAIFAAVKVLAPSGRVETEGGRVWQERTIYNQRKEGRPSTADANADALTIPLGEDGITVHGNVKVVLFRMKQGKPKKIGGVWFHTAFCESNYLKFQKSMIDKVCKTKSIGEDFALEVFMHRVAGEGEAFMERMAVQEVSQPDIDHEDHAIELHEDLEAELAEHGIDSYERLLNGDDLAGLQLHEVVHLSSREM